MSVPLGHGSFGAVYKETVEGRVCAVKKIRRYHGDAAKEVEMMSKLDCPFIIKLFGHCFEGTTLCIQMEFADEGTFEDFMIREAFDLCLQLIPPGQGNQPRRQQPALAGLASPRDHLRESGGH